MGLLLGWRAPHWPANESRDWRIYADFAQGQLTSIARPLYAADPIGVTWIRLRAPGADHRPHLQVALAD